MKAIVCTRWGPPDVLELREVGRPTPRDDEVLIRIHATTVTAGDCEMRGLRLTPLLRFLMRIGLGLRGPRNKVIGQELAGEIQSVGKNVRLLKTGDQVFAATGFRLGAYAEYICLPEDGALTTKPANITYEEAAAVPVGGIHALHFLRKANIQNGQKVLIIGAGGKAPAPIISSAFLPVQDPTRPIIATKQGVGLVTVGNPSFSRVVFEFLTNPVSNQTKTHLLHHVA